MPLFAVWARDRDDALTARERVREAHRARLRAPAPHAVVVLAAGPMTGGAGGAMDGTLLVVRAASAAAVRAFVEDDPYVHAGVYASVDIQPWRCGLGPVEWNDA
ncbi:YciI family protein [Piscinibacter sp.]|uniref:YciI family protein n=1 Tax=Piscinibacter sp. TaxID=1903157 RepID=UPI002C87C4B6|nr:YciI family protein [Albitalea sp.]HUG25266.1 YciI family protein [Albitalea sp.]